MRVLVTGNRGKIGRVVCRHLTDQGHEVVSFDRLDSEDVCDQPALSRKAHECEALVHLAAVIDEKARDLMAVNLLGTWNVLRAAETAGIARVVFMSSVNALGIFLGHRDPDYFPIDDAHPSYAYRPYSLSKRLGEQMCEATTMSSGLTTICLRPPAVLEAGDYDRIRANREKNPEYEWNPLWEYGAFLDVHDCATAVERSLAVDFKGFTTLLLCAADISASRPAREMAQLLRPNVGWRAGSAYDADPYRSLVDTRRAQEFLGWQPQRRWRGEVS